MGNLADIISLWATLLLCGQATIAQNNMDLDEILFGTDLPRHPMFRESKNMPESGLIPSPDAPFPNKPAAKTPFSEESATETLFPKKPAPKAAFPNKPASETSFSNKLGPETPFSEEPALETPFPNKPAPEEPFIFKPAPDAPFPNKPAPESPFPNNPAPEAQSPEILNPVEVPKALPPQPIQQNIQARFPTTIEPEEATSPSCSSSRSDTKDLRFYYQKTVGLGWIRRRCPQGTGFNNLTCFCSNVINSTDTGCQAEFYFNFERNAKDHSNNSLPVGDTNVKIIEGAGEFTGVSKIIMWRYSGAEFRNGVSARLSYKPTGNDHQTQALLTNCDSAKTKPTIGVVLNKKASGHELLIFVRIHRQGEKLLTFPSKLNDWNDASFSFDGRRLTGIVNGIANTLPASGSLVKGSSGLVLGRCNYYNWFTGLMDEVYIYPCVPSHFKKKDVPSPEEKGF